MLPNDIVMGVLKMEYKNFFLQAHRMKIRTKWIPGTCKVGVYTRGYDILAEIPSRFREYTIYRENFFKLPKNKQKKLIDLIEEYANTPVNEREKWR